MKQLVITLLLVFLSTVFLVATTSAESDYPVDSSETQLLTDTVMISGKVRSIDFATKTVTIKPKKERKVSVTYGPQTDFKGFASLDEIEKRQRIKIWYFKRGEENMAIRIQLIPELGC